MVARTALLCAALALAGASAQAVTVNLTRFPFPPIDVTVQGDSVAYSGPAGKFEGLLLDQGSGLAARIDARVHVLVPTPLPTSFEAYCAELTQVVDFGIPIEYTRVEGTAHFGAAKAADISRLFSVEPSFVVDGSTSAAFQSALWEIIYEPGSTYDLTGGQFTGGPDDAGAAPAFAQINLVLANLSAYAPLYHVEALANPEFQDLIVASATTVVPEPQTWALMLLGLAGVGWAARRR